MTYDTLVQRARTPLFTLALAVSIGLVGCGGGDDAGNKASPSAAETTSKRALAAQSTLPVKLVERPDPLFEGLTIPVDAPSKGMWSGIQPWPMNAIHMAVMPNGRVLSYGAPLGGNAQAGRSFDVWTPELGFTAGSHASSYDSSRNDSFCSTASTLADGRLLLTGGNTPRGSTLFSPGTQTSVTDGFALADDRWYATSLTLPDGRIVIVGGIDPYTEGQQGNPDAAALNGQASMTPEIYTPTTGWRSLTGATSRDAFGPDYLRASFPHAWVMRNGQVFGISAETMWSMDVDANAGRGALRVLGKFKVPPNFNNPVNVGLTSVAVMYAPGRILQAGGNGSYHGEGLPASAMTTVVDINGAAPVLTETNPMRFPRRLATGTLLPNGQVLVTGGTRYSNNGGADAVMAAEIWDPATGNWSLGANAAVVRVYHSNTALLPNGTVLSAGGGTPGPVFNLNAEVYYPPYLFTNVAGRAQLAPRPVMTGLSARGFAHGASGTVEMKAGEAISRLVLVANSTATHGFNNTQRRVELAFRQGGDRLSFTLPSATEAPPGYYQLIAFNAAGVPSTGTIVSVGANVALPPAPPSGTGTGLLGSYFANAALTGSPALQRNEAVNFDWQGSAPAAALPADNFSVRWTGTLEAIETGTYPLRITADDGVRLYVNNRLLVQAWRGRGTTVNTTEAITLTAGQRVPITLEYFDGGGNSGVQLSWLRPGGSWDIIPASQLYGQPYTPPPGQPETASTNCAAQGQSCTLAPGQTGTVWFGVDNAWVRREGVTGSLACTAASFPSDPAPTATKSCRVLVTDFLKPAADAIACANQDQVCALPAGTVATVWFGVDTRWSQRTGLSGSPVCNVATFADPAPGVIKACRYQITGLSQIAPFAAPPVPLGQAASWSPPISGPDLRFSWSFGDGNTTAESTTPAASRSYAAPGLYTVTLTARSVSTNVSTRRTFFQAVHSQPTATAPRVSSPLLIEPRTAAPARLWVVNADNDSVSVIDTASNNRVAEIAVGTGPRSVARAPDGRLWVVNRDTATISVIDPTSLAVVQTLALPAASQPHGLVIAADGTAYVTLEARGEVVKLAPNGTLGATLALGGTPRHLSLTADGARLLVSRFISAAAPGEATAVVNTAAASGEVAVVATATMARQATALLRHSDRTDAENQGGGLPNYLGAAAISPDGSQAWVPSKQDNIRRGVLRSRQALDFQSTVRAISSRIDLATLGEDLPRRVDHDNSSVATAAAYDPTGSYLFVALETSRQVDVLNARTGQLLIRLDVGLAPQGVAVSADGSRLYVHNLMGRSISVFDLTPLTRFGDLRASAVATVPAVAGEKLPAAVLQGKRLFYDARDPRLAKDSYMSCASCHADGGHDGRTWDFTGFGEGVRNTPSLRGRAGTAQGLIHWSGNFDEVQDFEGQIRAFAGGTGLLGDAQFNAGTRSQPLGDRKAGLSADLDALAAYLASLNQFAPSPWRNADRSLSADALAGRAVFQSAGCAACHSGAGFTGSAGVAQMKNIGTLKPASGQRLGAAISGLDVPTLRDVWSTAPYLHDGSAPTLAAAVQAHAGNVPAGTALNQLVAYLQQIGSEEAAPPAYVPPALVGQGRGLLGSYFANNNLLGTASLQRTEVVNFEWGRESPAPTLPYDNFSVRWQGELQAMEAGVYQFQTRSDDGVRLSVNGTRLINNWTTHWPTIDTSVTVSLTAGQRVPILLEYYEIGLDAVIQLSWKRPGQDWAIIPATQLYSAPVAASATATTASATPTTTLSTAMSAPTPVAVPAPAPAPAPAPVPVPVPVPTVPAQPPATAVRCASEGQACVLPPGRSTTVWFGNGTRWAVSTTRSGTLACTNASFGNPFGFNLFWFLAPRNACFFAP